MGITGSLADDASTPETYLSDFLIEWEPLPRATFYMLEVRDDFGNVYYCRTAATSATIVADYDDGLNNSGSDQVLQSAGDCLWNTDSAKRIQANRTYNWRVRAIDFSGSATTAYQQSSLTIGSLPTGVQSSSWSATRYLKVKTDDRTPPATVAVDLDLDAFALDNPATEAGQPAPLMKWSRAGQFVSSAWTPAPAYEVILYKNPERTTEIGHFLTPSAVLSINGVLDDNTTSNPYYATVRPVSPTTSAWKLTDLLLIGGVDNNSLEAFTWQKSSNALTGLAAQTLGDGSVRLSWNPQSVTGIEDGGSRGYQVRIYNGATQQGVTKKVEYPFFMAQKPATSDDSTFPSTATDVPLPPGNNYSFDVAPLDANGNAGPSTKSAAFSVGIATPSVSGPATIAGGSAVFSWSSVPGALKYSVQYRRVGAASWSTPVSVSQTSAAVSGFDQGNYEWQVRAFDAADLATNVSPWSASQAFSIGAGAITQQTSSAAVLPLSDRILRWESTVDGAVRFQVQIADDAAFSQGVRSYETDATSIAIPDSVTAAKQYYWRVKALSEELSSPKVLVTSSARTFTVLTTPAKLGAVTLSRVGVDLNAAWTPLAGAAAGTSDAITYLVQYRIESVDSDWSSAAQFETTMSASSVLVTGLDTGTSYQFRVAGKNSEGVGAWSDVKTLATAAAPQSAPNVTVTSKLGSLYLTGLSVADNGGSAVTGYRIEYRPTGTDDWTTQNIGAVSSYTLTGLANTASYDLSIAAVNIVGYGPAKLVVGSTLGVPSAPQTVAATRGDKAATITWTAPETPNGTISGYVIQYRPAGTTGWLSAGATTESTLKFAKTSLTNGKTYEFRVAAKTSVGTGDFSAPVSVVPAGKPILSSTPTAVSSSTGTVTISWGKANANGSAITAYVVKYSTNGTTWYTLKTVSGTTYKTTSTKGSHGKRVYFRLYAKNGVGTSAYKSISVIRK